MNSPALLTTLAVVAAYLLGSIPTGYIVPRLVRGIDIREHGSGNVGATNVGRVMGLPYFVLVMLIDLLKGFLPTYFFPLLIANASGTAPPEAGILTAVGAIVGHNFPVFLGFKGGKGVATSLGCVLALDPVAGACAAMAFAIILAVTRIVSISSILGAACFLVVHFSRIDEPLGRDQAVLTVALGILFAMLVIRHRSNIARLIAGTEARISFRRRDRSGHVATWVVAGVAIVGLVATGLAWLLRPIQPEPVQRGPLVLHQVSTHSTGRQRAGDLVFSGDGRRLLIACTRYNRVQFLDVQPDGTTSLFHEVAVEGRPVALAFSGSSAFVVQRPIGDARHLEEAYWQQFDLDGQPVGSKFRVGWDPDDLAFSPDGRTAFVLCSGRAEGETNRPAPDLAVIRLGDSPDTHRVIARLPFDHPGDDPERLSISSSGLYAAVSLNGTDQVASLDLSDPEHPVEIGRAPLLSRELPALSLAAPGDPIVMPVSTDRDLAIVPGPEPVLVSTVPEGSALELVDSGSRRSLGRFALSWTHPWNEVRPTGIAVDPSGRLLAVANRAGGVHLIRVSRAAQSVATSDGGTTR